MTSAIHEIPPAPRRPLWSAVLWHRWPLALAAFVLGVYGGLWALMFAFAEGGKPSDDRRLDAEPSLASGTITEVRPVRRIWRGRPVDRVAYRFDAGSGVPLLGRCYVSRDTLAVGDAVTIEFDAAEPHINRTLGGRLGLIREISAVVFYATVVPGLVCLLLWIVGVLRLRRVLARGDVAVAELLSVRRLRFVLPGMLAVRFRFKSHRAEVVDGHHWVRERSALGIRVRRTPPRLAVSHDRARPAALHRLVVPEYFEYPVRFRVPDRLPENL